MSAFAIDVFRGTFDWAALGASLSAAARRMFEVAQFFDGLFPVSTLVLFTLVASPWVRLPHCAQGHQIGFFVWWSLCALATVANAVAYELKQPAPSHPEGPHWFSFSVRQVLISSFYFLAASLCAVNNFYCTDFGRVLLKRMAPALLVGVFVADLARYTTLDGELREVMHRLTRLIERRDFFGAQDGHHSMLATHSDEPVEPLS